MLFFPNSRPLIWHLAPSSGPWKGRRVTQFSTFRRRHGLRKLFALVLSDGAEGWKNHLGTHLVDPSVFDYFLFFMRLCQKSAVYSSRPRHLKKLKARVINTIYEVTQQLVNVSTDWKIRLNDVSGKLAVRSMARNINVFVWNDEYFAFMLYWHLV